MTRRVLGALAMGGLLLLLLVTMPAARAAGGHAADVIAHDPVIIKQGDTWYVFCTGQGIRVYSSHNMKDWTREPPVFAKPPAWTQTIVKGFKGVIWAPDIFFHDGRYTLYYAVSAFGTNTSAIGVATNVTLDRGSSRFHWVDHGIVLRSIPGRDLWNAIDPHPIVDASGTPWLAFGSFWTGLKLTRLRGDGLRLSDPQAWSAIAKRARPEFFPDAKPGPAALEAPFIYHKHGWYYLFMSWDHCCRGVKSNYKIMVGRSRHIRGPYVDKKGRRLDHGGGSLVLAGNARYHGVGSNAVAAYGGTDYLVFHAYDTHDHGKPKLKILPLHWDGNGWPQVDSGALGQ